MKLNWIFTLGLTALLLATPSLPVFAQDTAPYRDIPLRIRNDLQLKQDRELGQQNSLQTKRDDLQERLANMQDQRKARIIGQINESMHRLNTRLTTQYNQILDKIQAMLDRIDARAQSLDPATDISSVTSAVETAQNAIDTARTTVEEQAEKDYTIVLNTETTIREDVVSTKNQLKADLMATRETVKTARTAVQAAMQALRIVVSDSIVRNVE